MNRHVSQLGFTDGPKKDQIFTSYCRNFQVMRALIVVGFAGLVFLTRQRT